MMAYSSIVALGILDYMEELVIALHDEALMLGRHQSGKVPAAHEEHMNQHGYDRRTTGSYPTNHGTAGRVTRSSLRAMVEKEEEGWTANRAYLNPHSTHVECQAHGNGDNHTNFQQPEFCKRIPLLSSVWLCHAGFVLLSDKGSLMGLEEHFILITHRIA